MVASSATRPRTRRTWSTPASWSASVSYEIIKCPLEIADDVNPHIPPGHSGSEIGYDVPGNHPLSIETKQILTLEQMVP